MYKRTSSGTYIKENVCKNYKFIYAFFENYKVNLKFGFSSRE